jgi:hypothetical protein
MEREEPQTTGGFGSWMSWHGKLLIGAVEKLPTWLQPILLNHKKIKVLF